MHKLSSPRGIDDAYAVNPARLFSEVKYTMRYKAILVLFSAVLVLGGVIAPEVRSQDEKTKKPSRYIVGETREMFLNWLIEMKKQLEETYYDRNFNGIDLDKRFEAARSRIRTLEYDWQMFRVLVQILMELDDSHTKIYPPERQVNFDYGFTMQMVGADCLIVDVQKGSDADRKGLAVGDRVVRIGRFEPTRANLWQIRYVLYLLDPTDTVELTVEKLNGTSITMKVIAKTLSKQEYRRNQEKKRDRSESWPVKCAEINKDVIACKLYSFVVNKSDIDKLLTQARKYRGLILDLRGNTGGYVDIEEYLIGAFFGRNVKIADIKTRKKTDSRLAKSWNEKSFSGELTVLIDSKSASASEVFSRVIQIEKRGRVIGDRSAGAVMTSITMGLIRTDVYGFNLSTYPLGMSLTIGDVIMSDGNRLEHVGVIPDVPIIPTRLALSNGYDPVLSAAAAFYGVELTPEMAGRFNFINPERPDSDEGSADPVGR